MKYALLAFLLALSGVTPPAVAHDAAAVSAPPPAITRLLFGQAQLLRAFATNLMQRLPSAASPETLAIDAITWEFMSCHVALATIADTASLYSGMVDTRDKEAVALVLDRERSATIALGETTIKYLDRQLPLVADAAVTLQIQLGRDAIRAAVDALKTWDPQHPR